MYPSSKIYGLLLLIATLSPLLTVNEALAVDTLETFDEGLSNAEFYASYHGFTRSESHGQMGAATVFGYGFTPRFSAFLGFTAQTSPSFELNSGETLLGVFGTVLDSSHVDLDLLLAATFVSNTVAVEPGLELNIDITNSADLAGLFFYLGAPLTNTTEHEAEIDYPIKGIISGRVGAYFNPASRHQVLFEYRRAFDPLPLPGQPQWESAQGALGYNVQITDGIEAISEASIGMTAEDDALPFAFSFGIIATLPTEEQSPQEYAIKPN